MIPRQAVMSVAPAAAACDADAYYTAMSPTPGTGLATIAALASLADTSPFVAWATGANSVYLDYLKLTCTVVGGSAAAIHYAVKTDKAKTAPTGGTTITPNNVKRPAAGATPAAATSTWYAGPLVAAAAITPLLHTQGLVRVVAPVVGDTYLFKFGSGSFSQGLPAATTVVADRYMACPPVEVGANNTGQFHIWLPAQTTASSFEVEVGFFEFP